MSITTTARRGIVAGLTTTLAAGAIALGVGTPAQAASEAVHDATFTWGLSGYAQKGIFGPWTYKNVDGDASILSGSVAGGSQTDYVLDPVPATSMPASSPQKSANAVRFSEGEGTVDRETGASQISWSGSYTVNAYPTTFGAPDEIYSDPKLTVAADGSGTLTMDLTIGSGVDMSGNPVDTEDFGRVKLMTFDAGSLSAKSATGYRVTPDYQGVEFDPANGSKQDRTCTDADDATGWWGAWPTDFLEKLDSSKAGQSVMPHFYSTGCGGMQDNKPPLPFDVSFEKATTLATTTSVTAKSVGYGQRGSATVAVKNASSGKVTLAGGGKTWTKNVDAKGKATFALPNNWAPGKRTLTASYQATATTLASKSTVNHTVTKAKPVIKRIKTVRASRKKSGWTKVKITWAGGAGSKPTGTIRAWITRGNRKLVGSAVKVNSKAKFPKATSKGTWKLHLRYYGDKNFAKVSEVKPLLSIKVK